MIDLRKIGDECVWPEHLKPSGYGGHSVEDFGSWRARNNEELNHLPEALTEQWIYRHWNNSVASFIPIEELVCVEENWPANDFVTRVGTVRGNEQMDPVHDYEVFNGKKTGTKLSTAEDLDKGYWDYPVVVLDAPGGFIDCVGDRIESDYILVEGHKRRRYLNALLYRDSSISDQRVFSLHSPRLP